MSAFAGYRLDEDVDFDGICWNDRDQIVAILQETDDHQFLTLHLRVSAITRAELEALHTMIGGYLQRTA